MHLHFASSPSRPNASIREIARCFRGTDPRFTLSATGFHSTAHLLALLRLGARYISCFFGDNYPTPRPNPLYPAVAAEGASLEHWSLGSYVTALRAGALGQDYATASSLVGTSLGAELGEVGRFFELPDPAGGERTLGVVRAMHPDVAFLHAAAGDVDGTFVASPPYGEGFWSAFGAKEGVIVTVDRLCDGDLLERCADWIKVPAYRVLAVCEEPFGAHPQPLYVAPRDVRLSGYVDDFEHYELWRRISTDPACFADFSQRVLAASDGRAAYRAFVGEPRLAELRASADRFLAGRARTTGFASSAASETMRTAGPAPARSPMPPSPHASRGAAGRSTSIRPVGALSTKTSVAALSPNERLVLLAARAIVRRVTEQGHQAVLAGIGASFAAARVAKLVLQNHGRHVQVMVETGLVDLECGERAHPFLLAWMNIAQAARLSSVEEVLQTLTCGAQNRCLGVIGAAEVDARGDINSTRLASGELLVGSGGANDIAASASDVIVVVRCDGQRLVPRVHHVTSAGRAVQNIATDRCVLSRGDGDRWSIEDVYPDQLPLAEEVAGLRTRCRFPELDTTSSQWAEPPTALELAALAAVRERRESKACASSRAGGA
jgi:acyl CoA:acetate/3-ketoacid CoA transferase beta subunit/acyl CoA:acetate/3-ketoacid CoA transferase alpha subunit